MKLLDKILGKGRKLRPKPTVAAPARQSSTDSNETKALLRNFQIFSEYNEAKKKLLCDLLPERKRIIFDLIPLLVHVKADDLLNANDACRVSPAGVYDFKMTPQVKKSFEKAFPGKAVPQIHPQATRDPKLPIKSISLIGSMGSVAQGSKSDFDYWICFEDNELTSEVYGHVLEKLKEIEKWADDFAGAEVHCFPLSISAVREDDFGTVDAESSGTAQGKLLKEEFYRSLTLVAGQTPLWWTMPSGIDDAEYARLKEVIETSQIVNSSELIDLGNVHDVSFSEFYGATIWQINKTLGSPFKSVLKLALLEETLVRKGERGLLCHELKSRLQARSEDINTLDPYVLMFDRVSEYFFEQGRTQHLDLVRRSFYLKSGVKLSLADHRKTDESRKKQVMINYVNKWGWNHRLVDKLNNYEQWSFREVESFNREVNRYLLSIYKKISSELKNRDKEDARGISPRDMAVLGRKLYVFYSRRTNKIQSIMSVVDEPPALKGMTLQQKLNDKGSKRWLAYRGFISRDDVEDGEGGKDILSDAGYITEILLWMVHNRVYNSNTTINLNQGLNKLVNNITVPDIQAQFKVMDAFFPPFNFHNMKESELLNQAKVIKMFLGVNVESPDWGRGIKDTALCYLNNWGELFFKGFDSDEGVQIARQFIRQNYAYDLMGARENFQVFIPKRPLIAQLGPKLDKFFGFKVS